MIDTGKLIEQEMLTGDLHVTLDDINYKPVGMVEVVRCKDCKHSEYWYKGKQRCFLWSEIGIDVFDDGFCSYGGRRDDAG